MGYPKETIAINFPYPEKLYKLKFFYMYRIHCIHRFLPNYVREFNFTTFLKLAFTLSNFQDKDLQANKRSYQRRVPKFEIPNIHIRALNGAWLLLLEC